MRSAVTVFRELHESGCFVMPNPWDRGGIRKTGAFDTLADAASFDELNRTFAGADLE